MHNQFYSLRFFFISFMLSIGIGNTLTAQTVDLLREDYSTGGDGTVAGKGDLMHYTIIVTNNTSSNISTSTVYGQIPAGTAYMAGTTTINGVAVSDVNGQMPFRSGGLVNSASAPAGVVAPNTSVHVDYMVKVNANMGSLSNTATLQATNSSGTIITVTSPTVATAIQADPWCNQLFESTATVPSQGGTTTYPYRIIKSVNTTDGSVNSTFFSGPTGPCYDAITGASLPVGSVLTDAEAIALAPRELGNPRIYFVNGPTNNPAQDLCYIDYVGGTTSAYRFTNQPLETNTGTGYNVTRMAFNGDGYGYALTANALDLIQFSVDPSTNMPTITPLGALINDAANGAANDVLSETGGDMFGDASGNLYLIPVSGKIYRINPVTRVATYIAAISGLPATGTNSVAVDANGYIYVSGAYQAIYRASFTNLASVKISSGTVGTWKNGDFTSCIYPIVAPVLSMTKTWADMSGNPPASFVFAGDPVEYTITITNSGNIGAAPVKLSDVISTYAHYIANSTTMNGVAVADIGGAMPFAAGSQYINSAAAATGIVMPGDANKVVIKFRVTTDAFRTVCNQAVLTFTDFDGNITNLNSDDPSQAGVQDQTCFWSDWLTCTGCRTAISGTLKNDRSVLQWAPVKKADSIAFYEMEYSDNGTDFTSLGKVPAGNLENAFGNYQFTDNTNTSFGQRNYRLKIVQENGKISYSNTVQLNLGASVKVQPNPFVKDLNVQVQLNTAEQVKVRLIDFYGRTVYTATQNVGAGYNSLHINVPAGLAPGVYVLELSAGNNRLVQKKLMKK